MEAVTRCHANLARDVMREASGSVRAQGTTLAAPLLVSEDVILPVP
jgi:hypothetical protein